MESIFEGSAQAVFKQTLSPVQITKRAVKEMNRNKLVGTGRQYAPTLYNVLVSVDDDRKLTGFYPTLTREIETFLTGKAQENGLEMDGSPLVRFIVDDTLRRGKFDVIAENVASPIIKKLRAEEYFRYGLGPDPNAPQPREAIDDQEAVGVDPLMPASVAPAPAKTSRKSWTNDEFPPKAGSERVDPVVPAPSEASASEATVVYGFGTAPVLEQRFSQQPVVSQTPVAKLVDVSTGETYQVMGHSCMLGREEDCDVRILDANVSRHHASILYDNGEWIIEDLNSTNGTSINHHRITRAPLRNGDILIVGVTKLQFQVR